MSVKEPVYADFDKNKLFPEVKPMSQLEPIDKDDLIVPDDVGIVSDKKEMPNNIFIEKKEKVPIEKDTMTISESDVKEKPKRDYSYLKEARKKGHLTRKEKAELRKKQKEEEKAKKAIERQKRREATAERNRQKARERYHKKKQEKEELKKKAMQSAPIVNNSEINKRQVQKRLAKQTGMDFDTFANYMMKYEQMKSKYNDYKKQYEEKKKPKSKPVPIPQKPKSYYSGNYPQIFNSYNPNGKYKSADELF